MKRRRQVATWSGAILGACLALLMKAHGQNAGRLTEEFHHVYPLSANGRIELENINGGVHITSWDRNEVKIDAIKSARSKERLDEAKIEVSVDADFVSIRTHYPDRTYSYRNGENNSASNNPASVEYTLTVPRKARLDAIKLINGSLDVHDLAGEVHASCINGAVEAHDLGGPVTISTINGKTDVTLNHLAGAPVEISSVNGGLELTLPSDSKAELTASSMQGGIADDFGIPAHHHFVGHNLHGELGGGGTKIKLNNVNGQIRIHRANDGRTLSPAKDFDQGDKNSSDI